ncbi:hypothetical protein BDQ12DRAFT_677431 [Crucibulum laeve]|uniref:F-box domain-containing protein n=1 Tax=Crucibulum laeve TaxID=68775 RepID=A0A5C3M973_9AGAR|nr:hypothetical protein BDQ12DRAFT_677431 [Crucibulum laeve]
MSDHQLLPTEIWLQILELVVVASGQHIQQSVYIPFQSTPGDVRDSSSKRHALPLVCQKWRLWSTELLYRDIRIRHGARALREVLDRPAGWQEGYGKWVRRVVLPYPSTVTGPTLTQTLTSIEILKLCPHIETLIRPRFLLAEGLRFEFDAESLPLPSLRRLEWWHNNEAERSGGINSLGAVLRCAPNLEYLFVGGVVGLSYIGLDKDPICLPTLQTLRIHLINGLLLRQIVTRWSLPALTRVITDSPVAEQGLDSVWETFGPQLKTVEFGKHMRFLLTDNISPCLKHCPSLEEFNYYLFFTEIPKATESHATLTTVGLNAAVNSFLVDGESVWSHLASHFDAWGGTTFPALRRIVLYGDWRSIIAHPRFPSLYKELQDRRHLLRVIAHQSTLNAELSRVTGC